MHVVIVPHCGEQDTQEALYDMGTCALYPQRVFAQDPEAATQSEGTSTRPVMLSGRMRRARMSLLFLAAFVVHRRLVRLCMR